VLWKTPMPGASNATPVLVGDRLFVTAEPTTLLAVRASDGQILWQRSVTVADTLTGEARDHARRVLADAEAAQARLTTITADLDRQRRAARATDAAPGVAARLRELEAEKQSLAQRIEAASEYVPSTVKAVGLASATPVSDGTSVAVVFANMVAATFDLNGQLRWARTVDSLHDARAHAARGGEGQAASPLLVDGRLIIPLLTLRAFDISNGDLLWEADSYDDFGTPAVARIGGVAYVATPEGHIVRVDDGQTVAEGISDLCYASPVVEGHNVFYAGDEYGNNLHGFATAIALPDSPAEPFRPRQLWTRSFGSENYYASALVARGRLFMVDRAAHLTVLDARTGATVLTRTLASPSEEIWSSPALAGDDIFFFDQSGAAVVLSDRPPFEEVARNTLEPMHASPVFEGRRLYLRGQENLYCITEEAAE
jgi:outer membrane protein assembly factor BamB